MQKSRWEIIAAKIRTLVKQLDSSYILIAEPVEFTGGLDASVKENKEWRPRGAPRIYKEAIKTIAKGGNEFKDKNRKKW